MAWTSRFEEGKSLRFAMTMLLHDLALYTGCRTVLEATRVVFLVPVEDLKHFLAARCQQNIVATHVVLQDGDHHATVIRIQFVDLGEVNL